VLIPMHYRDGSRGPRRLEHVEELTKHYAPSPVRHYDTDRITITADMEPQIAVLKFLGLSDTERGIAEKKPLLTRHSASKLPFFRRK